MELSNHPEAKIYRNFLGIGCGKWGEMTTMTTGFMFMKLYEGGAIHGYVKTHKFTKGRLGWRKDCKTCF